MATNNTAPATKVVVPCRISFANIWEPKSINGSEEKYSVSCLIPKSDKATLAKIQKAVDVAKEDARGKKWNGKIPPNLMWCCLMATLRQLTRNCRLIPAMPLVVLMLHIPHLLQFRRL